LKGSPPFPLAVTISHSFFQSYSLGFLLFDLSPIIVGTATFGAEAVRSKGLSLRDSVSLTAAPFFPLPLEISENVNYQESLAYPRQNVGMEWTSLGLYVPFFLHLEINPFFPAVPGDLIPFSF